MIADNLTPRERQIRETLLGLRGTPPDEDAVDSHEHDLDDEAHAFSRPEAQRAETQFAVCVRCRQRYPGGSDTCPECGHVHTHRYAGTP